MDFSKAPSALIRRDIRQIRVSHGVSAVFDAPDLVILAMDQSFDAHNAERLRAADTLLLARTTYELFKGFWP